MWYAKTNTVSVIAAALSMMERQADKYTTNKIAGSPDQHEIQNNCTLWNYTSPYESTVNITENTHPKVAVIKQIHRIHIITYSPDP